MDFRNYWEYFRRSEIMLNSLKPLLIVPIGALELLALLVCLMVSAFSSKIAEKLLDFCYSKFPDIEWYFN